MILKNLLNVSCPRKGERDITKIKKAILEANSAYTIYEEKGIIYAY